MVDQELGKIPRYLFGFVVFLIVKLTVISQESINRMGVFSIDINLFHDREVAVVFASDETLDLFWSPRFLLSELIAREGNDFQTFRAPFVIRWSHMTVVVLSQAAF